MPPGLQPCHFDPYVTYILGGFAFSLLIGLVWFRVWFRVWEAHPAVGKLEIIEKAFQAPQTQLLTVSAPHDPIGPATVTGSPSWREASSLPRPSAFPAAVL